MIQTIFAALSAGDYEDSQDRSSLRPEPSHLQPVCRQPLGQARPNGGQFNIPDLWCNTAQVIAGHPDFQEAARGAGAWNTIQEILDRDSAGTGRNGHA